MKKLGQWLIPAAATAALIEALVLAALDRVPAATLVAGVFVVVVLFYYFPQLEYFKAFTVEAKLREKLNEAENILTKIRNLAKIDARQNFLSLGYMNRMASIDDSVKHDIAISISQQLVELGISDADVKALARPYLGTVLYDLKRPLSDISSQINTKLMQDLERQRSAIFGNAPINMSDTRYADWQALTDKISSMRRGHRETFYDLVREPSLERFRDVCEGHIQIDASHPSFERLVALKDEVVEIGRECIDNGLLTERALRFMERNKSHDLVDLKKERFPELVDG